MKAVAPGRLNVLQPRARVQSECMSVSSRSSTSVRTCLHKPFLALHLRQMHLNILMQIKSQQHIFQSTVDIALGDLAVVM